MIDTNTQNKLEGLGKKIAERGLSKDVRLPDWDESKRLTPNSFLRGKFKQTTPKSHRILRKPTADKALRQLSTSQF